jgi:hypothetical protein
MPDDRSSYLSYLLRLWRVSGVTPPLWHASLEHPRTHERRSFADLASLFVFLQEQMGADTHQGQHALPNEDEPEGDTPD